MKRTWRVRLGQVKVRLLHGLDEEGVWTRAQYAVQLTGLIEDVPRQTGRKIASTMTARQARGLARVLVDLADVVDKQNAHAGYRVAPEPETQS